MKRNNAMNSQRGNMVHTNGNNPVTHNSNRGTLNLPGVSNSARGGYLPGVNVNNNNRSGQPSISINNSFSTQDSPRSEINLTDLISWVKKIRAKWQDKDPISIHDKSSLKNNINHVFSYVGEIGIHDGSSIERETIPTVKLTLLHAAIIEKNIDIISFLMKEGSNVTALYTESVVERRRHISGGQGFNGQSGPGKWLADPAIVNQKTCNELANNDPILVALLNYTPTKKKQSLQQKQQSLQEMASKISALINEQKHTEAMQKLNKIITNQSVAFMHPIAYSKMAHILLDVCSCEYDPKRGLDCLKKSESRIEEDYFTNNFGKKIGKKEKNDFDKLKLLAQFGTKFPKQIKKRKRNLVIEDSYAVISLGLTGFLFNGQHKNSVLCSKKDNTIHQEFDTYQVVVQKKKLFETILSDCEQFKKVTLHSKSTQVNPDPSLEFIKTITINASVPLQTIIETERNQLEKYRNSTQLAAQELEMARQIYSEDKYFNNEKCRNTYVTEIGNKILNERYDPLNSDDSKPIEIDMTNKPASLLIAAEKALMELSIKSQKKDRCSENSEMSASLSPGNKNPQNKANKTTKEWIRYGKFQVKYKTPNTVRSPNHQGDYEIEGLGAYQKIAMRIQSFIGDNREKSIQLTAIMLSLISQGTPIEPAQLENLGVPSEKAEETAEFFTKVCVNLIKETCRRKTPEERRHIIPYAAIQAKSLLLARDGIIHLTEIFSQDAKIYQKYGCQTNKIYGALFGIPTTNGEPIAARDNVVDVRRKGRFINEFSNKATLKGSDLSFFAENCPGKECYFISSQKRILDDLQTVYGGAEDMDKEGYSSEEEYSPIQVKKQAL